MQDVFGVTEHDSLHDLVKQLRSYLFLDSSASSDVGKQVSASTNLHYKDNVLRGLKRFMQSDNILVLYFGEDVEFLHNLLLGDFLAHELLVD